MIDLVIDQRRRDLGGFEVGRVLPSAGRRMIGPFIFFDHMGPATFAPGIPKSVDVRPHPHIGLSTVSYLFAGDMMHRDSLGVEQPIRPGEVNWMTAGRGVTHSERFEKARAEGGELHGIQSWVALPDGMEEVAPSFAHHGPDDLPVLEEDGAWARVLLGAPLGLASKVKTSSPMSYMHWTLAPGGVAHIDSTFPERAAYVASGAVEIDGRRVAAGSMAVFSAGADIAIEAVEPATVMTIAGEPLGPRFIDWNFVSSSKDRIEQAKSDWRAGRMKLPDLDDDEFIPLPD